MNRSRKNRGRVWVTVLLVTLCAAMTFGGSFTCNSSTSSDATTQP